MMLWLLACMQRMEHLYLVRHVLHSQLCFDLNVMMKSVLDFTFCAGTFLEVSELLKPEGLNHILHEFVSYFWLDGSLRCINCCTVYVKLD